MSDEDVKYLPPAAVDEQVKVKARSHFRDGPFEAKSGSYELRARSGKGESLYLQMPGSSEEEFVTAGIESYQALKELTRQDSEDPDWIINSDYDSGTDISSPGFDEMSELREKYEEQLDNAVSDQQEREILAEMWEEAAAMDLEGRDHFG